MLYLELIKVEPCILCAYNRHLIFNHWHFVPWYLIKNNQLYLHTSKLDNCLEIGIQDKR